MFLSFLLHDIKSEYVDDEELTGQKHVFDDITGLYNHLYSTMTLVTEVRKQWRFYCLTVN